MKGLGPGKKAQKRPLAFMPLKSAQVLHLHNKLPIPHCPYFQLCELSEVNDVHPIEQGKGRKHNDRGDGQDGCFMED